VVDAVFNNAWLGARPRLPTPLIGGACVKLACVWSSRVGHPSQQPNRVVIVIKDRKPAYDFAGFPREG
jgi:hypothetical protein